LTEQEFDVGLIIDDENKQAHGRSPDIARSN